MPRHGPLRITWSCVAMHPWVRRVYVWLVTAHTAGITHVTRHCWDSGPSEYIRSVRPSMHLWVWCGPAGTCVAITPARFAGRPYPSPHASCGADTHGKLWDDGWYMDQQPYTTPPASHREAERLTSESASRLPFTFTHSARGLTHERVGGRGSCGVVLGSAAASRAARAYRRVPCVSDGEMLPR